MDTSAPRYAGPTAIDYLTNTADDKMDSVWHEKAIPFELHLTPLFAGKLVMDTFTSDIHAALSVKFERATRHELEYDYITLAGPPGGKIFGTAPLHVAQAISELPEFKVTNSQGNAVIVKAHLTSELETDNSRIDLAFRTS